MKVVSWLCKLNLYIKCMLIHFILNQMFFCTCLSNYHSYRRAPHDKPSLKVRDRTSTSWLRVNHEGIDHRGAREGLKFCTNYYELSLWGNIYRCKRCKLCEFGDCECKKIFHFFQNFRKKMPFSDAGSDAGFRALLLGITFVNKMLYALKTQ